MINGKYLSEVVDLNDFETGVINLIDIDCGGGKTFCALNKLTQLTDSLDKILYLIDTCAGRDQILQNENTKNYDSYCDRIANGEIVNFEEGKIVVMTYAKAGSILKFNTHFLSRFNVVICDELHQLPKYVEMSYGKAKQLYYKSNNLTESMISNFSERQQKKIKREIDSIVAATSNTYNIMEKLQIFASGLDFYTEDMNEKETLSVKENYVIALSATPTKIFKSFWATINEIEVSEKINAYEVLEKEEYQSIASVISTLKKGTKGAVYMPRITEIEKIIPLFKNKEMTCGAIWSIHNSEHPMTEEQKALREYIIKNQLIPEGIDVLFYTASYETSININSPVDWVIVHSSNLDTIKQAKSRIRNDIPKLFIHNPNLKDEKINISEEWLDKPLNKAAKKELCELVHLKDKRNVVTGWTTLKRALIENGYKIEDKIKTVKGKRESVSIISL